MKKLIIITILLVSAGLTFAQTRNFKLVKAPTENPTNQKRKAMIIGMGDYGGDKSLNNTLNDARDMADVLTRLGFEVTLLTDNDLRSLSDNLANWYKSIENNDMAIFYFAGHGIEVNGQNYLIPIGAELTSAVDAKYNTLNVNQVLENMEIRNVGMKLLILDACRNNPFARSWTRGGEVRGLAQMAAPQGTYIAFAASPGATAQDGGSYNLRNGVFTHYLKEEILKPGIPIDNIFNNVAGGVASITHSQQIPYRNSSLIGNFYFIPRQSGGDPVPPPTPSPTPVPTPTPSPISFPTPSPTPVAPGEKNGDIYNPDGMEMVYVEGNGGESGTPTFYIGRYEVTQAQWTAVMGSNPSDSQGDNLPVERVNWNDVQEFINKLNAKTGRNYRLPTEAEWEFAAKGGTISKGYTYSGSNTIDSVAWYKDNRGGLKTTHPVGTKQPNELGIYDMSGNVWEWCNDWYDSSQAERVLRGGSWANYAEVCSSTYQSSEGPPTVRASRYGFRLALSF